MSAKTITPEQAIDELKRRGRWPGSVKDPSVKAREKAHEDGTHGLSQAQLWDIAGVEPPHKRRVKTRNKSKGKTKSRSNFDRSNPLGLSVEQLAVRQAIRERTLYGVQESAPGAGDGFDPEAYAEYCDEAGISRKARPGTHTRPVARTWGKFEVTANDVELTKAFAESHDWVEVEFPAEVPA